MRTRSRLTSCVVKQPFGMRLFNATVALVALGTWIVASNHCALADIMPKAANAQDEASHCHVAPEAPAQNKERDCDGSKCCKSLSAPSLALGKNIVSYDATLFGAVNFAAFAQQSPGSEHEPAIAEIDTGPPPGVTFAEAVLQRSILAHAPPLFA